jgi:two-component system sensor histidine kinase KdpD
VSADDPVQVLVTHLRTSFGLDGVSILRSADGDWVADASAGAEPPLRPEDADIIDKLAPGTVLALRGRDLTADDRRVLVAFAAQLAGALERSQLTRAAASAGALAETNALRAALLQAVSHDLRTPLAAIKASVSSLRQPDVEWNDADTAQFLAAIEDQTDRLTGIVSNLLDMSRLQAGVIEPDLHSVGLEEVVSAAVRGIDLERVMVDAAGLEVLPPVSADAALLERVIANLVDNAVAASPLELPVQVSGCTVNGGVALHVVDRGRGIPRGERSRVTEPFHRLGDAHNSTGVGLGLAVARGFVDAMRGELALEDTPGGGLTAIVTLPRAP